MRPCYLPIAFVLSAFATSSCLSADGELLGRITVDVGEHERVDVPVSVALPASLNAFRQLRLIEVRGEERMPVPSQVEQGTPAKLWLILAGKSAAGSKRRYELYRGEPIAQFAVQINLGAKTLDVRFKGARLFSYNHGHVVPPEGVNPLYIRSGYIHPMYNPAGHLVTEDFPSDHYHHKGIWFPWTKTEFDGHEVDFWNLGKGQGTVQFAGFDLFENGAVYGRFKVKHEHIDLTQGREGKIALDETWDIRVWNVGGPVAQGESGSWLWDITSSQSCASDSVLHLKAYRYGGFAFRGAKEWKGDNYVLLTSEGKTKKNGHTTRAKWCAHSGAVDGKWSTVVLLCHPQNERFPEPMRIWPSGGAFFNYTPIQKADWDFKPGEPHTFRYRFFIHMGEIDRDAAERAWLDFGEPPTAKFEAVEG